MSIFRKKKTSLEEAKDSFLKARKQLVKIMKNSQIREISQIGGSYYHYDDVSNAYTKDDIPDLFESYIWIWRSIHYIAKHFARFKIIEAVETDKGLRQNPEGRWSKVLSKPNAFMSEIEFKRNFITYLLLYGESYLEVVVDDRNNPLEIYPVNPKIIRPIQDPIQFIRGFQIKDKAGNWHNIDSNKSKIFYFKTFNPKSDVRGLPRINPVIYEIITDIYAISFNKKFFKKGARFDFALETDEELDDDVFERLKKQFQELHIGLENFWSPPVLDGGVKIKEFQRTHAEMEYTQGRKELRKEILNAFEIDERLFVTDSNTKVDLKDIKRNFLEDVILPEVESFVSKLESEIHFKLSTDIKFIIDTSVVPELNISAKERSEIYDTYIKNGVMTINEVRQKDNIGDSVEWGDVWWMYKSLKPAIASAESESPTTEGQSPDDSLPNLDGQEQ